MSYFQTVSDTVRDHFLDEANLRWLRVVIDPDGTPATYTPVSVSCDASDEYQKWTFDIKNRDSISVGLHANLPCVVSFSHNGSDWVVAFTGYVSDDGFRRTRGMVHDDTISIDLVDATKRKGTKRKPEMSLLSGFDIVDTSSTSTSILHYLASLMGVTVETADITQTKTLVEIGKDIIWAELQKLRDAFHADMYFRFDGKLLFRSPLEDSYSAPTSEWTFQGDPSEAVTGAACRIRGRVEEVFLPVRCNYAKTDFEDLEALSAQVIYKNTEGYASATDSITIALAAGAYWPGPAATDVARLEYSDPESGEKFPFAVSVGTPTIGAYGSGEDIEATGGALEIVSFNGSTAATSQNADSSEIILWNNSAAATTIRKLTISGTPYRKSTDTVVEHVDAAVTDAVDYVEQTVDGTYLVDKTQAFDTLYHMVEEGKGRPRQFRFSAPFMPWIQRNAIVNVQMPDETAVRCRIDTYSHKNRGRTLQGMLTTLTCTQLGTHTPTGSPSLVVTPTVPAWQAKLTSIAPNAGATYRSVSTSTPTNPRLSDLWYQTDTQLMKRYSGTAWENTGASPLEASTTSGVSFENASRNVQILNDGTINAVNGNFSGTLTATEGQIGSISTEFLYNSSTGNTIASGNTFGDVITFIESYTGSFDSGSFNGTYSGKTYSSFRHKIEIVPRTPSYSPTYYFYATDGTTLTKLGSDTLAGDFVIFYIASTAEVNGDLSVLGKTTITDLSFPISHNISFQIALGTSGTIATRLRTIAGVSGISGPYDFFRTSCEGTSTCTVTVKNTDGSGNTIVFGYIVLNEDTTYAYYPINYGTIVAGQTKVLSANITIHPEDKISFYMNMTSSIVTVEVTFEMKCDAAVMSNAARLLAFITA